MNIEIPDEEFKAVAKAAIMSNIRKNAIDKLQFWVLLPEQLVQCALWFEAWAHLMLIQLEGLLEFAPRDRPVIDRCHDPIEDLGRCRQAHKE